MMKTSPSDVKTAKAGSGRTGPMLRPQIRRIGLEPLKQAGRFFSAPAAFPDFARRAKLGPAGGDVSCESGLRAAPGLKEPARRKPDFVRFAAPRVLFSGERGGYRSATFRLKGFRCPAS